MSEGKVLEWSLGLRNHKSGKYLTQETFGFALNANGPNLKKKQTFTLQTGSTPGTVLIKTHLGRYLYGLADGTWKGDIEQPNADAEWTIEPQADGTWAIKTKYGYYAHGTDENLRAYTKVVPEDGKWVVHLAMHPQVNVTNAMRKRYVHLEDGELRCNEDIPWGEDALLTFVFFDEHPEGRYGFIAANSKYLSASGKLLDVADKSCQFLLGFHDEQISLRDEAGNYLSCVGANAKLQVNKQKVTKDELFQLTDSEPQFVIQDNRDRFASVRQGVEIKCDQTTVTDAERFQLELDSKGKASFKSNRSTYWSLAGDNTVSASADKKGEKEQFTVVYGGATVQFVASNGKYVTVKSNGGLIANGAGKEPESVFTLTIINRPELVLRGQFGFVGLKGASGRVEVNKSRPEIFKLECKKGAYSLSSGGKYWTVDPDGVAATSAVPVTFYLEFTERSKFLIKHADSGKYLEGEQNGGYRATGTASNANTLWEY